MPIAQAPERVPTSGLSSKYCGTSCKSETEYKLEIANCKLEIEFQVLIEFSASRVCEVGLEFAAWKFYPYPYDCVTLAWDSQFGIRI